MIGFGFVSGFVPDKCLGSYLIRIWFYIADHIYFVSGSNGFVFGSCLSSFFVRVCVRVWFVWGSGLFRVRFASGFVESSWLVLIWSHLVYIWFVFHGIWFVIGLSLDRIWYIGMLYNSIYIYGYEMNSYNSFQLRL